MHWKTLLDQEVRSLGGMASDIFNCLSESSVSNRYFAVEIHSVANY